MSSGIAELMRKKSLLFALILYIGYLIILFFLAIPYIPEMLTTTSNEGGFYINPIIIFGGAMAAPAILVYVIFEFNYLAAPFLSLNRRVLIYVTFFLLFQFGINIILAVCLVLVNPNLLNLSTYSLDDSILIWIISCVFSLFTVILNVYIGWKWIKTGFERPNSLHWLVGYVIYFLTIAISVISIQILNPSVKNILLWPFSGLGIVGALNYFLVSFILFLAGLTVVGSSMFSSESDAFIGLVFMMGIIFMIAVLFLPFFYMITFYVGAFLANRSIKDKSL